MLYRLSQLKEIRHELSRARAIAEELGLLHLSNTLTHNLGVINAEILQLEKSIEPKTPLQPRRTSKKVADNPVMEEQSK